MDKENKTEFNQIKYINEFNKKTYANISFRVHKTKDIDILNALDCVPNKAEYIKNLIREDVKKNKAL